MAGLTRVEKLNSELERVWFFAEHLQPRNRQRLVAMEQFDIPSVSAISHWAEVADRLSARAAFNRPVSQSRHV